MQEELDNKWNHIKNSTGEKQKDLFIGICVRLIELKEQGLLDEENAAREILRGLQFKNLTDSAECEAIFDSAGTVEIPRTSSYRQPIGTWDEKVADKTKEKQWKELCATVENAVRSLKSK